jgi:hypothetical protein
VVDTDALGVIEGPAEIHPRLANNPTIRWWRITDLWRTCSTPAYKVHMINIGIQ